MGARLSRQPEEGATVLLGAHLPEELAHRFRTLALQLRVTRKALLEEAINDALAKERPKEIPPERPADIRRSE